MATIEKRIGKSGKVSYRAKVRVKGAKPITKTFPNKTLAKRWGDQTERELQEGLYFKKSEAQRHTVGDLIDRYKSNVLPHKSKSMQFQAKQLDWWNESIGYMRLADVTTQVISECRERFSKVNTHYGKPRSPATINRIMAPMRHAFNVAVNEWEWLEDNPFRRIKNQREARGRVRFLSEEEREVLLAACRESQNRHLYLVVTLAIATGMRKEELLNLRWRNIDFGKGWLTIENTKNGERRGVGLGGEPLHLLKEHQKIERLGCDLVFPSPTHKRPIDIRSAWNVAIEKAELTDFHFHDLRHTAASYLAMNGATLAEIAEVLGHKTLSMVKRYAHLSQTHTAGVVVRMNESVFGGGGCDADTLGGTGSGAAGSAPR